MMRQDVLEYSGLEDRETITEYQKKLSILSSLKNCHSQGYYKDVFVWFSYSNRVLSGVYPMSSADDLEKYCEKYYPHMNQMLSSVQNNRQQVAYYPLYWPIISEDGERFLGVSINRFLPDSAFPNYMLTFLVNKDFLRDQIGDGILAPDENAMLFNNNGELLFSYKKEELDSLPEQYRNTGTYELKVDGKAVTLLVRESESMNGFYAMALSHVEFFEPLMKIRLVSSIGIILSVLVGVFVVYRMSRNTYKPLEQVLSQLQDSTHQQFDSRQQSEFEFFVEFLYDQEKKKNDDRLQKKKRSDLEHRKELLRVSLDGRTMTDAELAFLEQQLGTPEYYCGGILQLGNCKEISWKLISFAVDNVFAEILEEHFQCDIIPLSGARYMILCGAKKEVPEELLEMQLKRGMSFLKEKFDVDSVFAMSGKCKELCDLQKMYRQAQRALEYRFLLPGESVIKFHNISWRQLKLTAFENSVMYPVVSDFLLTEQPTKEKVEEFVKHLALRYEINSGVAIETVNYFRYEMLNSLNRIWAGKEIETFKRQEYVEDLLEAENLEEYQAKLVDILYETSVIMGETSWRESISMRIKKYVDAHYMEVNLNVIQIGEAFGKQGAYLSQIFRDEYGMSLPNYISLTRVNQAKTYLKESKLTMGEIAEKVGFLSASAFIRTFKKLVGVTPGAYKGNAVNEE